MNNLGVFDALISKYNAQQAGYLSHDTYLTTLMSRIQCDQAKSTRKASPLMNRGYFARVHSIKELTKRGVDTLLLEQSRAKKKEGIAMEEETGDDMSETHYQIVNLGCGFDTSSLLKIKEDTSGEHNFKVFEVDHAEIVNQKAAMLSIDTDLIVNRLGEKDFMVQIEAVRVSSTIRLVASDLKDAEAVCRSLVAAGLNFNIPILILTECVMVYMDKEACESLCRAMSSHCQAPSMWISYDMLGVEDRFGQMMLKNLTNAGYQVPGFVDNPTEGDHEHLFKSCGWTRASCMTMLKAYKDLISTEVKSRIAKLEIFDEIEEWEMLMSHYCLTIATKF